MRAKDPVPRRQGAHPCQWRLSRAAFVPARRERRLGTCTIIAGPVLDVGRVARLTRTRSVVRIAAWVGQLDVLPRGARGDRGPRIQGKLHGCQTDRAVAPAILVGRRQCNRTAGRAGHGQAARGRLLDPNRLDRPPEPGSPLRIGDLLEHAPQCLAKRDGMKDREGIGILPIQDILNRHINLGGLVRVKRLLLQEDLAQRLLQPAVPGVNRGEQCSPRDESFPQGQQAPDKLSPHVVEQIHERRTPGKRYEDRFAFDSNRFSVGGGVPDSWKPGRAGPSQKSPDAAGSYKSPLQGCSATRCPFLRAVNERFIEWSKNRRDAKVPPGEELGDILGKRLPLRCGGRWPVPLRVSCPIWGRTRRGRTRSAGSAAWRGWLSAR